MEITDVLFARHLNGGGGGDITIKSLNVTQNGTYSEAGKAYSPVTVEVPPPEDSYQLKSITTPTSLATFNASAMPMPTLKVSVEAKQDLHGYDHPWVGGSGKNLFDQDTVLPSIGFVKDGDAWFVQYSSTPREKTIWENTNEISGSVTLTYTFKYSSTTSQGVRFRFEYKDGTNTDNYSGGYDDYFTTSFTSDASKTLSRIITTYGTGSVSTWIKDMQVNFGADMPYSPYSNICPISGWDAANVSDVDDVDNPTVTQTTTISLGQTVYGGELDVVNGTSGNKMTHGYVDLGSLTWYYRDSGTTVAPYFYADVTDLNIKYEGNFQTVAYHLLCSQYEAVARNTTDFIDGKMCADGGISVQLVTQIQIKDSRFTNDAASFKAAMSGVQLVYELATPTTFETQPTPIKSLNGQNNLSVDCGDVIEGEYFIAL